MLRVQKAMRHVVKHLAFRSARSQLEAAVALTNELDASAGKIAGPADGSVRSFVRTREINISALHVRSHCSQAL
jgi:hypothetical protein